MKNLVFRRFSRVVQPGIQPWTDILIIKPRPSLLDFTKEYVVIPTDLRKSIEKHLKEGDFCLIIGGGNTGKTWVSYWLAYYLAFQCRKPVWYGTVDRDFDAEEVFWKEIAHYYERNVKETIYFILDDCHLNRDQVEKFLLKIYEESELKSANLKFVFTTRRTGKFVFRNTAEQDILNDILVNKMKCDVKLSAPVVEKLARAMIRSYIEIKGVPCVLKNADLDSIIERCGNDLYLIYIYLRCWQYQTGQSIVDTDISKVYDLLWNGYDKIRLKDEKQKRILGRLAAICQFEPLEVPEAFLYEDSTSIAEVDRLIDEGVVQIGSLGLISIPESFSRLVLSTLSDKISILNVEDYSIQSFKEFTRFVLGEPRQPNWQIIFQALNLAEGKHRKLGRDILVSLLNDPELWTSTKKAICSLSIEAMSSMMTNIIPCCRNKAMELRSIYLVHKDLPKRMEAELKLSYASDIAQALRPLSRIINLNSLLGDFSINDFQSIAKRSKLYEICSLFHAFSKLGIEQPIKVRFAEALLSLLDTEPKLVNENQSLAALALLIRDIGKVDKTIASRFIGKVIHSLNVEKLIIKTPARHRRGGRRSPRSQSLSLYLSSCARYGSEGMRRGTIAGISNKLLMDLVISSSSPQDDFWLFWNIYRCDPDRARLLVGRRNMGPFLVRKWSSTPGTINKAIRKKKLPRRQSLYYLPTLGLLHECGIDISQALLPKKEIHIFEDSLKRANKWGSGEKPAPTLLVLSLVALRVKTPIEYKEKHIESILKQESVRRYVYQNADPQVGKILNGLAKKYGLNSGTAP